MYRNLRSERLVCAGLGDVRLPPEDEGRDGLCRGRPEPRPHWHVRAPGAPPPPCLIQPHAGPS
eukprot:112327-Prorocentrum_minimum.AAC.5